MAYTKPVVLAQNGKQGSFAATCPATSFHTCNKCDVEGRK